MNKKKATGDIAKVYDLIHDIKDRRGLRQEFEQIDGDIQDEIVETWLNIISGNKVGVITSSMITDAVIQNTREVKITEPMITDSDSWWTGPNRICTFASWQDAHDYWENSQKYSNMMRCVNALNNACLSFSFEWYKNMRELHKNGKSRGYVANVNGYKILTSTLAGRMVVTIKNDAHDDYYVTLVAPEDEDGSVLNLQGIYCDYDLALDWLNELADTWYTFYDFRGVNDVNEFKEQLVSFV